MFSRWKTLLRRLRGDRTFCNCAQRQVALRELEDRFHMRLSEEEVFQAAALFFALLADNAFINRDIIAQEVRRQFSSYTDEPEGKEGNA